MKRRSPAPTTRRKADQFWGIVLILPICIWLFSVLVYPLLSTLVLSFHNQRLVGGTGNFVGLGLYRRLVTVNEDFWPGVWNTVVFTGGSVVLQLAVGLLMALLLNERFWGRTFLRTWIIVPWAIPFSVIAIMARWMLSSLFGVINWMLVNAGLVAAPIGFLSSMELAMPTVVAVNVWKWFPFVGIMLLAVLQGIPIDQYEAARIDGSNRFQEFLYVTLPSLIPAMGITTLLLTFWNFNTFGLVWLMTAGGPGSATTTLPILVYKTAFQRFRMGEAAALSLMMFLFLGLYTVVFLRIQSRLRSDE